MPSAIGVFTEGVRDDITSQVRQLIVTSRIIRTLMLNNAHDSDILPFVNFMVDFLNDPSNEHGIWVVIELCARGDLEWSPSPSVKVEEVGDGHGAEIVGSGDHQGSAEAGSDFTRGTAE